MKSGLNIGSENTDNMGADTEVRIQISYDQVTRSYSTLWPEAMVGEIATKQSGDTHLLSHYENIHEQITIDQNGYMLVEVTWLDGHADVTMPPEVYERTKNIRPVHGQGHNPVVRSEMKNGYLRYYGSNNQVLYEYEVDAEAMRIDSELLDEIAGQFDVDPDARIANNIAMLQQQGINYNLEGSHTAVYTHLNEIDPGISESVFYLDLSIGKVTRSADIAQNGKVQNLDFMNYKVAGGMPVMQHNTTLNFGERNGEWVLTDYTLVNRDNIRANIY